MSLKRFEHNNFIETIMIEQEPIFCQKVLAGYYLERKTIDIYEVAEKFQRSLQTQYRLQRKSLWNLMPLARADEQPGNSECL